MALGKNYEMAHQYPSEHLTNHELWQEREQAIARVGQTGDYLSSVMEAFTQAQCEGYIPEELKRLNNEAHIAKVGAITWLMDVNKRIHEAGL